MYSKIKYDGNNKIVADFSCVFEVSSEQLLEDIRKAVIENIAIQELYATNEVEVIFSINPEDGTVDSIISSLPEKTFDDVIGIIISSTVIGIARCKIFIYGPEPTRACVWASNSELPNLSMPVEKLREFTSAERLYEYILGFISTDELEELCYVTLKYNHLNVDGHRYLYSSKFNPVEQIMGCIVYQLYKVFDLQLDDIDDFESKHQCIKKSGSIKYDTLMVDVMFNGEYKTMISLYLDCMEDEELNYRYFGDILFPLCYYFAAGNTDLANVRLVYVNSDGSDINEVSKDGLADAKDIAKFIYNALKIIMPNTKYAEQFAKGPDDDLLNGLE